MFHSDLLKSRVTLITGGGTGICRAIALAFARHGCDVAIISRTLQHLEPTAAELRALADAALHLASDAAACVNGVTLVVDGGLWLRSARMPGDA